MIFKFLVIYCEPMSGGGPRIMKSLYGINGKVVSTK